MKGFERVSFPGLLLTVSKSTFLKRSDPDPRWHLDGEKYWKQTLHLTHLNGPCFSIVFTTDYSIKSSSLY